VRVLRAVNRATGTLPRLSFLSSIPSLRFQATMNRKPSRNRPPTVEPTAPAVPETTGDAWQRSLGFTRAMLGASLDTSREWMQGLGEWQQLQATSLRHACERIEQAAEQTERATDWPGFYAAQAKLAGTQWTQAMDDCSALVEQAVQIETRLLDRGRADAVRWSQRWFDDLQINSPQPVPNTVDFDAPFAMFGQARTAMTEMSRLWTQAMYNTSLPD
jgi:hypothetical protein